MIVVQTIQELTRQRENIKKECKTIGFVPTMGALHEGHKTLLKQAKNENDTVICSIFVNPVQFNNALDLKNYPRDCKKDIAFIQDVCNIAFIPSVEEMYPEPPKEMYRFGELEKVMEGKSRVGHFNGVAIVVERLLNYVRPNIAYFGEKDYQQLRIVSQLVKELNIPVEIRSVETVREKDGLAISSRNQLLTPHERSIAPRIREILLRAKELKNILTPKELENALLTELSAVEGFTPEYVSVADTESLQPVECFPKNKKTIVCTAILLNQVRLIDNIII